MSSQSLAKKKFYIDNCNLGNISGWIETYENKATEFGILLDTNFYIPLHFNRSRPDVHDAIGCSEISGFDFRLSGDLFRGRKISLIIDRIQPIPLGEFDGEVDSSEITLSINPDTKDGIVEIFGHEASIFHGKTFIKFLSNGNIIKNEAINEEPYLEISSDLVEQTSEIILTTDDTILGFQKNHLIKRLDKLSISIDINSLGYIGGTAYLSNAHKNSTNNKALFFLGLNSGFKLPIKTDRDISHLMGPARLPAHKTNGFIFHTRTIPKGCYIFSDENGEKQCDVIIEIN